MALGANAAFHGFATFFRAYFEADCTSAGLAMACLGLWMALGIFAGLTTVIALGPVVMGPGFVKWLLRDEMAELDRRIEAGDEVGEEDDLDDEAFHLLAAADPGPRLWLYFLVFAAIEVFASNALNDRFVQKFSHPGLAIVAMRSEVPAERRRGLEKLTTSLDFNVTPPIQAAILIALADPDEGVAARAIHAAGFLEIEAAAPVLAKLARTKPSLTFTALIYLGQINNPEARRDAGRRALMTLKDDPVALAEPYALALGLALARTPAIARLKALFEDPASDEKTRTAAMWGLGRLRDGRLLETAIAGLKDPSAAVRCAAAEAIEAMVVFEASRPLQEAFLAAKDPAAVCDMVTVPYQEGGPQTIVVRYRLYHLSLLRAMATTDDPDLLPFLVEHQSEVDQRANQFMRKLYESLKAKKSAGLLKQLERRNQVRRMREKVRPVDVGVPQDATTPADAGVR